MSPAFRDTLRLYLNAPVLRVLMLGFASGLPSPCSSQICPSGSGMAA